jgi:hypothetical protein
LPADLVLRPAFLQATPFLTVAAFEVVANEVVASNNPKVAARTPALALFDLLTIFYHAFSLRLNNTGI